MSVFSWFLIGALTGWLTDSLTGIYGRRGLLLSVAVGIVAAVLGGLLFSGFSEAWVTNPVRLTVGGLFTSFLTATGLLLVTRLARITG